MGGAGNGVRTRDPKLGKLVLYQLSYARPLAYCKGITILILFNLSSTINSQAGKFA